MNTETCIVGIDIGGTNIRMGAVGEANELLKEIRIKSSALEQGSPRESLLRLIRDFINSLEVTTRAVSIGFPSTINRERTKVLSTPNLKGFDNIEIKQSFQAALGLPVFIEKDACMLIYNDIETYKIPTTGMVIGFYIGTGLGNVILYEGKPIIGKDGATGELGHIPVIGRDDLCGCGLRGCLEMYAGGKGLEIMRARKFAQTPIERIFIEYPEDADLRAYVKNIAVAVVTEVNILNPDYIVLSGGVLAMDGFPYDELVAHIRSMTRFPIPGPDINIIRALSNSSSGGVTGAAIFARRMLEEADRLELSGRAT